MYSNYLKFTFLKHSLLKLIFIIITLLSFSTKASDITEEVKSYISDIKSIAVEFTQHDSKGQKIQGQLIIDKPYKFRCNYYEPFPILIVGNKNYVGVYDYEMENLSRIKSSENMFNFLLLDKVNFENQFEIISAKEQSGQYVLTIKNADLDKISEISFDKNTKNIKKLQIFEEDNIITLEFGQTMKIKDVADDLFILKDPDLFDKPERLSKDELEKNYTIVK